MTTSTEFRTNAGFGIDVDIEPCHYCGLPADTIDHVVPQVVLDMARDSGDEAFLKAVTERHRRMVVAACRECNSLAGATFDATLDARKRRVKDKLRWRYRKLLSTPDWHPGELMQISERLRLLVIATIYRRDEVRKRVSW